VIGYASRTGTRRNLAGLRSCDWRLLVTATGVWRHEGFRYAIDNGAWRAFIEWGAGRAAENLLDLDLFYGLVGQLGLGADFIVAPDIVGEGDRSLALTLEHLPRIRELAPGVPILIGVQDGHEEGWARKSIEALIGPEIGVFVGGSTEWKERTMPLWCAMAEAHLAWSHVARVNTARRIALCAAAGAKSFDGTSASMYLKTLALLDGARRQPDLLRAIANDA
jgi:hypothetical protein